MAGSMCIGDAASRVDPFSGEGIGNAWVSAKMTSKFLDRQTHSDGFPEESAVEYMAELWGSLGGELTNSYKLQKLVKKKRLMNWFVKRAAKKEAIREMMSEMIASKEEQTVLWSPWFLVKTLLLP
jgi:flavin-dependent dehydrogenase